MTKDEIESLAIATKGDTTTRVTLGAAEVRELCGLALIGMAIEQGIADTEAPREDAINAIRLGAKWLGNSMDDDSVNCSIVLDALAKALGEAGK